MNLSKLAELLVAIFQAESAEKPKFASVSNGGERVAIGREENSAKRGVEKKTGDLVARLGFGKCGEIPKFDGAIFAAAGERAVVRRKT